VVVGGMIATLGDQKDKCHKYFEYAKNADVLFGKY
jgi:hypothetical protein